MKASRALVVGVTSTVLFLLGFAFLLCAQTETVLDSTETVSISSMDSPAAAGHGTTVFRLTDYSQRGRLAPPYPWNPFPQCPVYLVHRELNVFLVDDRVLYPDIEEIRKMVEDGTILDAVEAEIGPLRLARDMDLPAPNVPA